MDIALPVAFIIAGMYFLVFKGLLGTVLVNGIQIKRKYRDLFIVLGLVLFLLGVMELLGYIDFVNVIDQLI